MTDEHNANVNTSVLLFDQFGAVTPIAGTHKPEFFLNFDYYETRTSYQYYHFADAVFDTIVAIPVTVGAIVVIATVINIILFYTKLAELIQRRYNDAIQW
jgi:hypothetical protein